VNIRYFEKRPGAWHLDIRGLPGVTRARPYGGPTEAEARRQTGAIVARLVGSAPASQPSPAPAPAGPTLREAFKRALRERPQWLQAKDKSGLETTFTAIVAGTKGATEDMPLATWDRAFTQAARGQWLVEPGKRKGTTLSASTINHRLSLLSVLLEVAELPPHGVKHLSVRGNRRTRRITDQEVQAMVAWCQTRSARRGAETLGVLVAVALDCAARQGELLALSWDDYLPAAAGRPATLTFRDTKNGETRTVPLTSASAALLEARRALPAPFSDIDADRITALWSDMRFDLGLASDDEFVFHTLRHEAISRLVDAGVDAFTVQAYAGHASITTTQVYAHASLGAMTRALQQRQQGAPQ